MILVCGGLADSVTELVCARLEDCGYPYRLLDLGRYPVGYRIKWHWRDAVPVGYIAGPDWHLDLCDLTGVYADSSGRRVACRRLTSTRAQSRQCSPNTTPG